MKLNSGLVNKGIRLIGGGLMTAGALLALGFFKAEDQEPESEMEFDDGVIEGTCEEVETMTEG